MKLFGGWRRKNIAGRVWGQGCIRVGIGPGNGEILLAASQPTGNCPFFGA
jgi:hypothetical protein